MELRHLRYFVAVAEELNYRRAAARLYIAAPPLSVQIRKLEQEVGAPLFEREGRGIKLTGAGHVMLAQARKLLADADRSLVFARRAAMGEIGQLEIGHNMPAGFRIFPQVVPAFRSRWPDIALTFHSLSIPRQLDMLRREQLDVGFVWLPIPRENLEVHELWVEPLVAVVPAGHKLASADKISIADFSHQPLIIPSRAADPINFVELEAAFARAGAIMNIVYELENSLSMINFVAMGLGCCILPDYASDVRQAGVAYRPLTPALTKTLAILKRTDADETADRFFRFTIDTIGQRSSRRRRPS